MAMTVDSDSTLGEAFERCDAQWLAAALIRDQASWNIGPAVMGRRRFEVIVRKVQASLRCMEEAAALGSRNVNQCFDVDDLQEAGRCFIPCWRFELADRQIAGSLSYLWVDEQRLQAIVDAFVASCARPESWQLTERIGWGLKLLALDDAGNDRLAVAPWSEALAGRLRGVQSLSPYDLHCFLAAIFWTLTDRSAGGDGDGEIASAQSPPCEDERELARHLVEWLRAPVDPGVSGTDLDRFELAAARSETLRVELLCALAGWEALGALAADINRFET